MTKIELLKHQYNFVDSEKQHTGLIGGYGSGKTHAGTIKTILQKLKYPNVSVAYYMPTYPLIYDIAFPNFSKILAYLGVDYQLNISRKEFRTKYGKIILRSMDDPDYIVGYEVGYSLIDEADILSKSKMELVFKNILARSRTDIGTANKVDFVSTPEGFRFLHHFFVKEKGDNKLLIKASTNDNPYIPASYIEGLRANYTEAQLKAYIEGEFVNLTTGLVYRCYANCHTDRVATGTDTLHVGLDFNVSKMSAVIHVTDGSTHYAVDEIYNAYDTTDVISRLKTKYPRNRIVIYPDASGNARNTAGKSDFDLLRDAGLQIVSSNKNPNIRDRINAMNLAFERKKYLVNQLTCPNYSNALLSIAYVNGQPDKNNNQDHITDAGGYYIHSTATNKPFRAYVG